MPTVKRGRVVRFPHSVSAQRQQIARLQRAAKRAQVAGDLGRATELAQLKLDAVRRLHGVAS